MNRTPPQRWLRAAVILGLCCLLGWAGFAFRHDLIRIATNQGELQIETDGADIEVEVLKNGEVVQVVDTVSRSAINISAGSYTLRPGNGEGEFSVTPDVVTLSRGGKQVVKVTRSNSGRSTPVPPVVDPAGSQRAPPSPWATSPEEPTYNGRVFSNWVELLKTERNPERICEGIVGLAHLASNDARLWPEAVASVKPLIRRHGAKYINSVFNETFLKFFDLAPPPVTARFTLDELSSGTVESLAFLDPLFKGIDMFEGETATGIAEHYRSFEESSGAMLDIVLKAIAGDPSIANERTSTLVDLARESRCWLWGDTDRFKARPASSPDADPSERAREREVWLREKHSDLVQELVVAFDSAGSIEQKVALASILVRVPVDHDAIVSESARALTNESLAPELRDWAWNTLWQARPEKPREVLGSLLDFAKRKSELVSSISDPPSYDVGYFPVDLPSQRVMLAGGTRGFDIDSRVQALLLAFPLSNQGFHDGVPMFQPPNPGLETRWFEFSPESVANRHALLPPGMTLPGSGGMGGGFGYQNRIIGSMPSASAIDCSVMNMMMWYGVGTGNREGPMVDWLDSFIVEGHNVDLKGLDLNSQQTGGFPGQAKQEQVDALVKLCLSQTALRAKTLLFLREVPGASPRVFSAGKVHPRLMPPFAPPRTGDQPSDKDD